MLNFVHEGKVLRVMTKIDVTYTVMLSSLNRSRVPSPLKPSRSLPSARTPRRCVYDYAQFRFSPALVNLILTPFFVQCRRSRSCLRRDTTLERTSGSSPSSDSKLFLTPHADTQCSSFKKINGFFI